MLRCVGQELDECCVVVIGGPTLAGSAVEWTLESRLSVVDCVSPRTSERLVDAACRHCWLCVCLTQPLIAISVAHCVCAASFFTSQQPTGRKQDRARGNVAASPSTTSGVVLSRTPHTLTRSLVDSPLDAVVATNMTPPVAASLRLSRRLIASGPLLTSRPLSTLTATISAGTVAIAIARQCRRPLTLPQSSLLSCGRCRRLSSAVSSSRSLSTLKAADHITPIEQLEASLVSQLPSASQRLSPSAPLSSASTLPVVLQLVDVYLAQHKYGEAERLLWRLCDEQTGGGGTAVGESQSEGASQDERTVDAIHTLYRLLQVREGAVRASVSGDSATSRVSRVDGSTSGHSSGSTEPMDVIVMLDELLDRYHSLTASTTSTVGGSTGVVLDSKTNIQFIQALTIAYKECGERSKAEQIVRSTLLCDEKRSEATIVRGGESDVHVEDARRYRYAVAHYFLGVAAYNPPSPEAAQSERRTAGHGRNDGELKQYDWSESEVAWNRTLAYLNPFMTRLSSTHSAASLASVIADPDSVTLHLLRLWVATEDNLSEAQFTNGQREAGMAALRRSIDTMAALLPSHDSDLLRSRCRLIARLLTAEDQVSEAQRECAAMVSIDPSLLSVGFMSDVDELARSFSRAGDFQYAARLFQLSIAVRELAADVTLVAQTGTSARYNDLGHCELQLRQYAAAEQHLRRSMELEAVLGSTDRSFAITIHNLGAALQGQQRYDEAARELQRARQLYETMYESEQQPSSRSLQVREAARGKLASALGQCYERMKRWTDSVAEHKRAVDIKQRALGDHPITVASLNELGLVLMRSDAEREAVGVFSRLTEMVERIYGAEHSLAAEGLHWQAMAEGGAGQMMDAVSHARQAVLRAERLHALGAMEQLKLDAMKKTLASLLRAVGG